MSEAFAEPVTVMPTSQVSVASGDVGACVADEDPAAMKDPLHFVIEDAGIGIDP